MVFSWHFTHTAVPQTYTPSFFPLSLLNQGYTGVALFMTLSGYLFAKLLEGKQIKYLPFLRNRILRLAPLMFLVLVIEGIIVARAGYRIDVYCAKILIGFVMPTWPNGGWSIVAEFHFYLLLPGLLFLSRKSRFSLVAVLALAILLRLVLYVWLGQIQQLAYWTIIGRIDQFLLGMIAFQARKSIQGRHLLVVSSLFAFAYFFWRYDQAGGFYHYPAFPSTRALWVYLPTLEGLAYGLLIAWYDNSFQHATGRVSRGIALIGTCSYSIYLLHFFFYEYQLKLLTSLLGPSTGYLQMLAYCVLGFLMLVPMAYLSFKWIESPFLKFRTHYLVENRDLEKPMQPAGDLAADQAVS